MMKTRLWRVSQREGVMLQVNEVKHLGSAKSHSQEHEIFGFAFRMTRVW